MRTSKNYTLSKNIDSLWAVKTILTLRSDLKEIFILDKKNNTTAFLHWLLSSGLIEYRFLLEDNEFVGYILGSINNSKPYTKLTPLQTIIYSNREDVKLEFSLPEKTNEFVKWFYQHAVKEYDIYVFLTKKEKQQLKNYYQYSKKIEYRNKPIPLNPVFGVNLIGYACGQLGIGEDLRMAAKSLNVANIPFCIINFPPGDDISQNELSMMPYIKGNSSYTINIFCLTALEHARFFLEKGQSFVKGFYNIGYWPWELSQWPQQWQTLGLTHLVDEVWVSTRHTYNALAPVSPVPVLIMPMTVELGAISPKTREDFNLPQNTTLFCFSFDLNSSIHRKNPQACVDSFLNAFPLNHKMINNPAVGLVIKVHHPKQPHPHWEQLKYLASHDPRIHIIEATLSRPDLLALYQSCDCFLSLHRAEGFGRGIAEAMQLGLHIITTNYSGNVDFCQNQSPQVDLVDYQLIPIKQGEYPYAENQVWADVDINHAAQLMQNFAKNGHSKRIHYSKKYANFSAKVVGKRYSQRIDFIENNKL